MSCDRQRRFFYPFRFDSFEDIVQLLVHRFILRMQSSMSLDEIFADFQLFLDVGGDFIAKYVH